MKCALINYEEIEKEFSKGPGINKEKHFPEYNFTLNILAGIREYIDDHLVCMVDIDGPVRKTIMDYLKERES